MEKHEAISKRAKYIMVGSMIFITIGVFLYMLKKAFEARHLYLKEEEEKSREGYAKLTILEEQEDMMEDNMIADYNINTDYQESNGYENFISDDLWDNFLIQSKLIKEKIDAKNEKGAQLKASMYYQAFAKYLKVHIIILQNLTSYELSSSSFLKLKVMVCDGISGRNLTETTKSLAVAKDIDVNEKIIFKIKEEELKTSTLYISLFCEDVFYQESLLGAVSLDLSIANYRIRQTISEEIIPVKKVGLHTLSLL